MMRRFVGVSFVLLASLAFAMPSSAQGGGQAGSPQETSGFQLEQNYPNPFNPETRIPFVLGADLFSSGQPVVVSMRIYNLLQQPVAAPVALRHPAGDRAPLVQLEFTAPGRYEAFWDGRDFGGNQVASGPYFVQITVNGVSKHMRMFVQK
ncbi:MAG TPA: hypothetical protein VK858_13665 [Longimicrobiales bacterium]|nr:hypothetical protein [Longimicrobiales bacterium]